MASRAEIARAAVAAARALFADVDLAQAAVRANLIQEAEYSNPGRMALAERRAAAVAALTTPPTEGK